MNNNKQELLEQLWDITIQTLISKIEIGDFTSQDLNIARQVLKDHGITVAQTEESPIGNLADVLLFNQNQTNPDSSTESFG